MRKIKFRGKNVKTGQIHYGFYSEYPVAGGRIETCITDKNLDTWEVEPESVAQLVGYDADGREVYEGDQLIRLDGVIGFIVPDVVDNFTDYKLAE